nr:tyrosine-type recombinase/integrase [Methylobacterium sp. L1A1]
MLVALEGAVETDDLAKITRRDLIAWKCALLASGRDPRTVRDAYVAAVKALMNWAVANGHLNASPAAGVVVLAPEKPRTRDREFTDAEAETILRAALGPHSARLSREKAAARRWIPWLCAYGGARVNEMTQLRGEDIRLDKGIWIVRVTPEAGRVKTSRWRDVPMHLDLIAQGFPEFVRARGNGPLFYDPERGRGGSDAHPIYKKVGERLASWVRFLGVDDPGVDPNHGWRHRFKTIGRRAGIDSAILDAIQGHATRTEGERYGRFPTESLFDAICRMPAYDLG